MTNELKFKFFKTNHEALMCIMSDKIECNLVDVAKTLNNTSKVKLNGTIYLVDILGLLD